jgi:hypothetical protein
MKPIDRLRHVRRGDDVHPAREVDHLDMVAA